MRKEKSKAFLQRAILSIRPHEEINRHPGPDKNDKPPHPRLRQFLGIVRRAVSSQDRSADHHDRLSPVDNVRNNERHHRKCVDRNSQHAVERVHGVNVSHADRGQHGQVHNADAATKVAAIHRDEEFED